MIDEKKLIEELEIQIERERNKCNDMVELNLGDLVAKYNHGEFCYVNALHLVQTQPKVGEWIPCSERLPENNQNVLVWFEYFRYGDFNCLYQTIGISYTWKGEWSGFVNNTSGWQKLRIIAWMPLPEPYRGEE